MVAFRVGLPQWCTAVQTVMTSLDHLQKFKQWVNLPFSPGMFIPVFVCFFLPLSLYCRQDIQFLRGPLHIRDQAPQLQHNVVFTRIDALSIAQIIIMWGGQLKKRISVFISSKRSRVNKAYSLYYSVTRLNFISWTPKQFELSLDIYLGGQWKHCWPLTF